MSHNYMKMTSDFKMYPAEGLLVEDMYHLRGSWSRIYKITKGRTIKITTYDKKKHVMGRKTRLKVFRPDYLSLSDYEGRIQGYKLSSAICECGMIVPLFLLKCPGCKKDSKHHVLYCVS